VKRLEEIISAYWAVGIALRHPDAPSMACGDALSLLNQADRLVPIAEESKLAEEMHTLTYDIIEGSDEWRRNEKRRVHGGILIQFTRN